jgi:hypothetical protein
MDYNFSDPLKVYGNVPFDTVNHTSSVVIVSNFQELQAQNDKVGLMFLVLIFLIAIDVGIEVLKYLKSRRLD